MAYVLIDTQAVKQAQKERGLTNAEVSMMAEMHPIYYAHFFRDRLKLCRSDTVRRLERALKANKGAFNYHVK